MTTDNFPFYLQNRLIQTNQTGGQWYSDTPPLVFPSTGDLHAPTNLDQEITINHVTEVNLQHKPLFFKEKMYF
jgi:hypothetical protein